MAAVDYRPNARFRNLSWSGPVTAIASLEALSTQLARSHPRGVQAILIGASTGAQGWRAVQQNGIIAILIGLLLPAVQRAAAPGAKDTDVLRGNLSANGGVGFLMEGDGIYLRAGRAGIGGVAPNWFALADAAARAA